MPHIRGEQAGSSLYLWAMSNGLEGVMAKLADSPYTEGRSAAWRKIKPKDD